MAHSLTLTHEELLSESSSTSVLMNYIITRHPFSTLKALPHPAIYSRMQSSVAFTRALCIWLLLILTYPEGWNPKANLSLALLRRNGANGDYLQLLHPSSHSKALPKIRPVAIAIFFPDHVTQFSSFICVSSDGQRARTLTAIVPSHLAIMLTSKAVNMRLSKLRMAIAFAFTSGELNGRNDRATNAVAVSFQFFTVSSAVDVANSARRLSAC